MTSAYLNEFIPLQEGDEDLGKSSEAVKEVVAGLKKSNPDK